MNDKRRLRETYAARREAAHCISHDEAIARTVLERYRAAQRFFVYISVRSEVATDRLIAALLEAGKEVCVPRIEAGRMLAVPYAKLVRGAFGIPAPEGGEDMPCDVALTPLLAFDNEGYRLGYGGGFYDAYFARRPETMRVGLAYCAQRADRLPHEEWDVPLHAVVTEEGIFRPGT